MTPFEKELDFKATGLIDDLAELLAQTRKPA
jgi:hypothetical protein